MLTVGEFSKICQVSVKTLHHYDKIGLLRPQKVDPLNGYRYYGKEQVEQMLLIGRLKRYGFSLEDVRLLLECKDERVLFSRLQKQKEKLKLQKQDMELVIGELSAHLRNFERTGDIMGYQKGYEIAVVTAPDQWVLASRQMMGVKDFGNYYSGIYERIAREHLTPDGLRGAVYHDSEFNPENSDIELIVGIQEKERADRILKGQMCARTIHKGGYSSRMPMEPWLPGLRNMVMNGTGHPTKFIEKPNSTALRRRTGRRRYISPSGNSLDCSGTDCIHPLKKSV